MVSFRAFFYLLVLLASFGLVYSAPTWVENLAIGEWYQVPGTTMQDVQYVPIPAGNGPWQKVDAWNSFVADPRTSKVYSAANGGHGDYAGNEVEVLELEHDPPRWVRLTDPTPASQVTQATSYYADGKPTSRHSYYGAFLDPNEDKIYLVAGAWWNEHGNGHEAMSSFNISQNEWNKAPTHPDVSGSLDIVPAMTLDTNTGDIYIFDSSSAAYRWVKTTNSWESLQIPSMDTYNTASAFDSTRNRIFILGGRGNERELYDIATDSYSQAPLNGGGASTVQSAGHTSLQYVEEVDKFYARLQAAGGAVYEIDPVTFTVTSLSTTGGGSIPAAASGPFNKFLYLPNLGGFAYYIDYHDDAWFFKLKDTANTPTVSISASPSTIFDGATSTLTWTVSNADSCTASGDWSGAKSNTGGTEDVTPSSTSIYSLSCTNSEGTSSPVSAIVTVNPSGPILSLSSNSLSFGSIQVNSTSSAQTVSVTNNGNQNLNLNSITVSGTGYAISSNNCGSSLTPSSNCQVGITFSPTSSGSQAGSLSIVSNDAASPHSVSLSGAGFIPGQIPAGAVLHYSFDSGTISGSTVSDLSGNGNDGTISGPTSTTGQSAEALSFSGGSDHVDMGNFDIGATNGMTISLWMNPSSLSPSDYRLISKATGVQDQDHYFMVSGINSDDLRFRLKAGGSTSTLIASGASVSTGSWTHVVATYDGSNMRIYQDNVQVGSTGKTGTLDTSATVNAEVGRNPNGHGSFSGAIDEIIIYDRALSVQEIGELFSGGGGTNNPPVASSFSRSTPLNTLTTFELQGSDPESAPLTYSIVSQPSNGVLTGEDYIYSYAPNVGFVGVDTFTYRVNDGELDSALGTVTINVNDNTGEILLNWDNFASRCSAPGVVLCEGFDYPTQAEYDAYMEIPMRGRQDAIDDKVFVSGNGSLYFQMRADDNMGVEGNYRRRFSKVPHIDNTDPLNNLPENQFGPGDEFFIQWRQRYDYNFLHNPDVHFDGGGQKMILLDAGDKPGCILYPLAAQDSSICAASCTPMELVTQNTFHRTHPQMYHSCGLKDNQYEGLSTNTPSGVLTQNELGCLHPDFDSPPCKNYVEDNWMTFMMHVVVGTPYDGSGNYNHDSTVRLYVAEEDEDPVLVIDYSPQGNPDACHDANTGTSIPACKTGYDLVITNSSIHANDPWTGSGLFGRIFLMPLDWGKDAVPGSPHVAHVWYDELIVSTQYIPFPTEVGTFSMNFNANSTVLTQGQSSELSWSTSGGTSCSASGAWSGSKGTGGTEIVSPTVNSTYTLDCTNGSENIVQNIFITVNSQPPADTVPPVRNNANPNGGMLPSGTTQTTISLTTDENAICRYATSPGVGYSSMTGNFDTTGLTSHSSLVQPLVDGQAYTYYVKCVDQSGNENSNDFTISFTVDPPGSTGPNVLSHGPPTPLPPGTTNALLEATTDVASTCRYDTNPGVDYNSMTFVMSGSGTTHSASESVSDGNSYTFYVRCHDGAAAMDADYVISFSVETPSDTTPPVMSNGLPSGELTSGTTSTTLSLSTDETANCRYSSSPGIAYSTMSNIFDVTDALAHSEPLSGLTDGNLYEYYTKCSDTSGNANIADLLINFSVGQVTNSSNGSNDTTAPVILNVVPTGAIELATNPVVVNVTTDEDSFCKMDRDPDTAYADMEYDFEDFGMFHDFNLSNLAQNVEHRYYVKCQDNDNNINAADYTFSFSLGNVNQPPPPPNNDGGGSGGGGGGGGGGGSSSSVVENINDPNVCVPHYIRSEWSACLNGEQQRSVTDQNSCNEDKIEKRVCNIANTEIDNKFLNAKILDLAKDDKKKRTYKTTLTASYNELFKTLEKVDDDSFIVVDKATGEEYLGRLIDEQSGEFFYSLDPVEESLIGDLKAEGLVSKSVGERVDSGVENLLTSVWFKTVVGIVALLLTVGVVMWISFYVKRVHAVK